MQDTWQNFLKEQTTQDNSDIDITKSPIVSPLSGFALLIVTGDDRHAFLQGQLINDLKLIEKPGAQLSAWCNPKGQVITNFIVINTGISYLLLFKQELKEFVQKRLTMFVMRSNVTIKDISESSPLLDVANIKDLSSLGTNIPTNAGGVHAVDDLVIICHPDNSGRYLITGSVDALIKKLPALNTKFSSGSLWEILDIFAGLPWVTAATQEQFLPQMLNLDALKSLSYQKGCYPGQEVIARLHYRGDVKKRLQPIKSDNELIVGDDIYLDNTENKVGTVINSSAHIDGNYYGLGVIELDKVGERLLSNNSDISILELPYST
ncbi:MAG: folate-binding protein YgfZ [Proteobacteria bacterium]|nr:folate-binding protein [Pseudomonadota bacterium]NOG59022.1 folate-binding protein YgfZ [Pseudomonadota bacterium]